jgi:hypothetical protein
MTVGSEKNPPVPAALPWDMPDGALPDAVGDSPRPAAFGRPCGRPPPKIGAAEFLAIARRFGFSPEAMARLRTAISDADLPPGGRTWAST